MTFYEKDPSRNEEDLEKLKNRQAALDLLGISEFSKEEKMKKVHSNFLYSYLVDDSYKVTQDNNPSAKEFEDLGNQSFPNNNRLVKRLDREAEWGLGGEVLKRKKNYFSKGRVPTPHEVGR